MKQQLEIIMQKVGKFISLFLKLDEERVSTVLLLTIISFIIAMVWLFTHGKIDPGLASIVTAGFYSSAGAAGIRMLERKK